MALHDSQVLGKDPMVPLLFLAKLSVHIPNKWEQIVRYYGYYSARTRGKRRKLASLAAHAQDLPIITPLQEPRRKPSKTWAECIKRIYEINPLECPVCKSEMRIISFITDPKAILDISKSLGFPEFQKPPPINSPPLFRQTEIFTDMELAYWDNYSQVAEPEKIQIKPKPDKNTPAKLQTADELLNLGLYKTGKKLKS